MADYTLHLGDCLEYMRTLPDGCVDAVVTDPPYLREYLPLYGDIAAESKRILRRGGSLVAIVPHFAMPKILSDVGEHLKYRWVCSMWQGNGSHPRMAMGIEVMWKPIVWWVNEAWPRGRGFVRDGFENEPVSKSMHPWEQSLSWAEYCMKFTQPGDTILDPFMGSGTTGVACIQTGRRFIGVEIDPGYFAIAQKRIEAAAQQPLLLEAS